MDDLKAIVSKNIIYLRTNHKMTQLELGEALSYSDKAVSKWERGEAVPDAYVLKKLSVLFHVSVDYLLNEHNEKELKAVKVHRFDRRVISLISFLGTWTLALVVFVMLWFFGSLQWLVFVYALPVSLTLMIVLTAVWGKKKTNIFYISFLVWSVIATIYLTFIQYNWWPLFVIGIPAQIIILLVFRIRVRPEK
ncbi:MAG: helix-turn-helix domain-containing protein [Peptococcaceae bacterium]|nr:helix-turn-helix domain-containing protein [Peptococcaceae bacterium]